MFLTKIFLFIQGVKNMSTANEIITQMIADAPEEIENLQNAIDQIDVQINDLQNKMEALDISIGNPIESKLENYLTEIKCSPNSEYYIRKTGNQYGNMLNVDGQITDWELYSLYSFQPMYNVWSIIFPATSNTSAAIGIGIKTFNTSPANIHRKIGMVVRIVQSTASMQGIITNFTSDTTTINVTSIIGSGFFSSWNLEFLNSSTTNQFINNDLKKFIIDQNLSSDIGNPIIIKYNDITYIQGTTTEYISETGEITVNVTDMNSLNTMFQLDYEIEMKLGDLIIKIPTDLNNIIINSVIYIIYNIENRLEGKISSYNSITGDLKINIINMIGSGTYNSWNIIVPRFNSITEMEISLGSKSFELSFHELIFYIIDRQIVLKHNETNYMSGSIVSYNTNTNRLTINITEIEGSGTYDTWEVNLFSTINETLSFSTGIKTLTVEPGLLYYINQNIQLKYDDNNYINGIISNINPSTQQIILDISESNNSNTYSSFSVNILTNSTSSLTINEEYKELIIEPNLINEFNIPILIKYDDDNYIEGFVYSYTSNNFYINSVNVIGSGTYSSWVITMFSDTLSELELSTTSQTIQIKRGPIIYEDMSVLLKNTNNSIICDVLSYDVNTNLLTLSAPTTIETTTSFNSWSIIFPTSSSQSVEFGTGSKTFILDSLNIFQKEGMYVKIIKTSDPLSYMYGTLNTYEDNQITVNITESTGTGFNSSWTIELYSNSVSEIFVGTGNKTLYIDSELIGSVSSPIIVKHSEIIYIQGTISTYDNETGLTTINITDVINTETSSEWDIEFYFSSSESIELETGIINFQHSITPIYTSGFFIELINQVDKNMIGQISKYDPITGTLIFNPTSITGSDTCDSWDVRLYTNNITISYNHQTGIYYFTIPKNLPLIEGNLLTLQYSDSISMSGIINSYNENSGYMEININSISTTESKSVWDATYITSLNTHLDLSIDRKLIPLPQIYIFPKNQIVIAKDSFNKMQGIITSYNAITKEITADISESIGTGTYNLWNIAIGKLVKYVSPTIFKCDGDQTQIFRSGILISYLLDNNVRGFATIESSYYLNSYTFVTITTQSISLNSYLTSVWLQTNISNDNNLTEFYNNWNFTHDYIWKTMDETGTYGIYELKSNLEIGKNILAYNKNKLEDSLNVFSKYTED